MPLSVAVHNRALGSAGERLVLYSRAMSRDEILARLREFEPALRERGIAHAALFDSAARGDNGPESDIDIMVEFAPEARVTRRRSRLCIRRPLRRRLLCGLSERSRQSLTSKSLASASGIGFGSGSNLRLACRSKFAVRLRRSISALSAHSRRRNSLSPGPNRKIKHSKRQTNLRLARPPLPTQATVADCFALEAQALAVRPGQ